MDITYALFWFVMGAVLARALSAFMQAQEQRDMIVKIMAQFLSISQEFKGQLRLALEMKKGYLEASGMSESEVSKLCENEEEVVEKWALVCTTIILRGVPKNYIKYFQKTNFKDFKQ